MAYTKFHDPWHDADSAEGGGDETTPLTAAALDHIEDGIVAAIRADLVDAKGDLLVGSAADTVTRLAVGADNEVPSASAGAGGGITWRKVNNAMVATNAAIDVSKLAPSATANDVLTTVAGVPTWKAPTAGASVTPFSLTTPGVSVTANWGNAFWTVAGLTDWDAGHWEFLKDVDGKVYGSVLVPSGVTAATVRLLVAANATTGVTRLGIGTVAVADAESLNPGALTDATKQDITVPGTAYLRKDVTFSLTGLSGADLLVIEIFHEGSHGNDTLATNTLLFGAWLEPA
jgi:hypothetical protein